MNNLNSKDNIGPKREPGSICRLSSNQLSSHAQKYIFTSQNWKLISCLFLHRIFIIIVSISSILYYPDFKEKVNPSLYSFEHDIDRYGLGQRLYTQRHNFPSLSNFHFYSIEESSSSVSNFSKSKSRENAPVNLNVHPRPSKTWICDMDQFIKRVYIDENDRMTTSLLFNEKIATSVSAHSQECCQSWPVSLSPSTDCNPYCSDLVTSSSSPSSSSSSSGSEISNAFSQILNNFICNWDNAHYLWIAEFGYSPQQNMNTRYGWKSTKNMPATNQRTDIFITIGLTDPGPLGLVLKINEFDNLSKNVKEDPATVYEISSDNTVEKLEKSEKQNAPNIIKNERPESSQFYRVMVDSFTTKFGLPLQVQSTDQVDIGDELLFVNNLSIHGKFPKSITQDELANLLRRNERSEAKPLYLTFRKGVEAERMWKKETAFFPLLSYAVLSPLLALSSTVDVTPNGLHLLLMSILTLISCIGIVIWHNMKVQFLNDFYSKVSSLKGSFINREIVDSNTECKERSVEFEEIEEESYKNQVARKKIPISFYMELFYWSWPTSVILSMPYSEVVFIPLFTSLIYFLYNENILGGIVCAYLLALTRPPAILILLPLGLYSLIQLVPIKGFKNLISSPVHIHATPLNEKKSTNLLTFHRFERVIPFVRIAFRIAKMICLLCAPLLGLCTYCFQLYHLYKDPFVFMNAQQGFIADFSLKTLLFNPFHIFTELFLGRGDNLQNSIPTDGKYDNNNNNMIWKRIRQFFDQRTHLTLSLDDPVNNIYDRAIFLLVFISLLMIGREYLSIISNKFVSSRRKTKENVTNLENYYNTTFPIPLWVVSFSFIFLPFSPLCGSFMSYSRFVLLGALPLLWFVSVQRLYRENEKKINNEDRDQYSEKCHLILDSKKNQWISIVGLATTTILQIFALRRFLLSKWLC